MLEPTVNADFFSPQSSRRGANVFTRISEVHELSQSRKCHLPHLDKASPDVEHRGLELPELFFPAFSWVRI